MFGHFLKQKRKKKKEIGRQKKNNNNNRLIKDRIIRDIRTSFEQQEEKIIINLKE